MPTGSLRDAQEVWDEVITALGQMSNETERDAYAMVLMGKSAQDLNPLIEAGADKINALRQEAHEAGAVLDEDMLATLGEMQDAFDRLSQQTDAFERILAGTLAPDHHGYCQCDCRCRPADGQLYPARTGSQAGDR